MNYLLIVLLLTSTTVTVAKKLYKYQDNNGHWHYTDQKPAPGQDFESRQLKVDPKRHVWLEKTGPRRQPAFFVRNTYYGPIELEVRFKKQINATAIPRLPHRFMAEHGQSQVLFKVEGANSYKPWQFTLEYSYTIGKPLPDYQSRTAYLPPLAPSDSFMITQGFGGQFSHQDEQNHYAVDIAMPVGTPVHAARSGIVMDLENDFYNSGTEQNFKSRANSIRILHDDGSMAIYAHLQLEKARVYPGLRVYAGQLIGYSGNTGYSTGPHLHFAIQINKGMKLVSVPFRFLDQHQDSFTPEKGHRLKGVSAALAQPHNHIIQRNR